MQPGPEVVLEYHPTVFAYLVLALFVLLMLVTLVFLVINRCKYVLVYYWHILCVLEWRQRRGMEGLPPFEGHLSVYRGGLHVYHLYIQSAWLIETTIPSDKCVSSVVDSVQ